AVPAFADSGFEELRSSTLEISSQLSLTSSRLINTSDDSALSENYYTFTPGGDIVPIVAFGNDIRGAAGYTLALQIESEKRGWNIIGGTNGDFFTVANGIALGACVRDGIVCTSEHSTYESVGFNRYGNAQIGRIDLNIAFEDVSNGTRYDKLAFNKNLDKSSGLMLYSGVYGPDNAAAGETINVLVSVDDGEARINQTVYGTVESVYTASGPVKLDADHILLCAYTDTPYQTVIPVLNAMQPGDAVEISFTGNSEWEDMEYVVGGEKRLLRSGGFADQTNTTKAPRTALGIKKNGDIVLYTADGRDSASSAGLTYNQLAQRMKDLGCVDAINLDGGGSTQLHCTLPGYDSDTIINKPSENRRCGNYIMFAAKDTSVGRAEKLYVYPYDQIVLAGSSLTFDAKASDGNYHAASMPGNISFSASGRLGSFDGNVFTASAGTSGTGTVNAQSGRVSGSTQITVVDTPDSITICDENGKTLSGKVSVAQDGTLKLSATAMYKKLPINADKGSFTWSVSDGFGRIDEDGTFYAENITTETGTVTASCGDASASIDVFVDLTAPTIELNENLGMVSAFIEDDSLSTVNVTATLDGSEYKAFSYSNGMFAADLTGLDEGLHHLVVKASDGGGNRSRKAVSIISGEPVFGSIFSDMDADYWAVKYVEYLNAKKVIYGKGDIDAPYFDPKANLTRQEFAAILIRWLGTDTSLYENTDLSRFKDAGNISQFAVPAVKTAVALGYISGKGTEGDLSFDPRGIITRQEAMAIIGRTLEKNLAKADLTAYKDYDSIANYARPHLGAFVEAGIISGSNGKLRPRDAITRAEVAVMIYNCY
ncbi:MAG: phosphodiester glycosidase family protein, partial [Firmicutes bacterium]|nr:phosphodiester glycosidase family protein [Bacillota bacterium]